MKRPTRGLPGPKYNSSPSAGFASRVANLQTDNDLAAFSRAMSQINQFGRDIAAINSARGDRRRRSERDKARDNYNKRVLDLQEDRVGLSRREMDRDDRRFEYKKGKDQVKEEQEKADRIGRAAYAARSANIPLPMVGTPIEEMNPVQRAVFEAIAQAKISRESLLRKKEIDDLNKRNLESQIQHRSDALNQRNDLNTRDNQTRLEVARIQASRPRAVQQGKPSPSSPAGLLEAAQRAVQQGKPITVISMTAAQAAKALRMQNPDLDAQEAVIQVLERVLPADGVDESMIRSLNDAVLRLIIGEEEGR